MVLNKICSVASQANLGLNLGPAFYKSVNLGSFLKLSMVSCVIREIMPTQLVKI